MIFFGAVFHYFLHRLIHNFLPERTPRQSHTYWVLLVEATHVAAIRYHLRWRIPNTIIFQRGIRYCETNMLTLDETSAIYWWRSRKGTDLSTAKSPFYIISIYCILILLKIYVCNLLINLFQNEKINFPFSLSLSSIENKMWTLFLCYFPSCFHNFKDKL